MQTRSAVELRARIVAANNILNALFMVAGALAAAGLLDAGVSIPTLFALAALINALVAFYVCRLMPHFLLRFLAALLVRAIYRVDDEGLDHIPESGPAVLVCNHVSFIDPVVVFAMVHRPIDPSAAIKALFDRHDFKPSFVQKAADMISAVVMVAGGLITACIDGFDWRADPDGRYRINECYCFDSTWRAAVRALLARASVVLMDLRGFRAENQGCRHELRMLAQAGRLRRVVVLHDSQTARAIAEAEIGGAPAGRFHWLSAERLDHAAAGRALAALFGAAG